MMDSTFATEIVSNDSEGVIADGVADGVVDGGCSVDVTGSPTLNDTSRQNYDFSVPLPQLHTMSTPYTALFRRRSYQPSHDRSISMGGLNSNRLMTSNSQLSYEDNRSCVNGRAVEQQTTSHISTDLNDRQQIVSHRRNNGNLRRSISDVFTNAGVAGSNQQESDVSPTRLPYVYSSYNLFRSAHIDGNTQTIKGCNDVGANSQTREPLSNTAAARHEDVVHLPENDRSDNLPLNDDMHNYYVTRLCDLQRSCCGAISAFVSYLQCLVVVQYIKSSVTVSSRFVLQTLKFMCVWLLPTSIFFVFSCIVSLLFCCLIFGVTYWAVVPTRTLTFPVHFNYRPSEHFPLPADSPTFSFKGPPLPHKVPPTCKQKSSKDFGSRREGLGDDFLEESDTFDILEGYDSEIAPTDEYAQPRRCRQSEQQPSQEPMLQRWKSNIHNPVYPIDMALAYVSFNNRSWELFDIPNDSYSITDSQESLHDSLESFNRPTAKSIKPNEQFDVFLSFMQIGPAFVTNIIPGPFYMSQGYTAPTPHEFGNPQPLLHEPIMLSLDIFDTHRRPLARSVRPFIPQPPAIVMFRTFLQGLPVLLKVPIICIITPVDVVMRFIIGDVFPWIASAKYSRVNLMEGFPNRERNQAKSAELRMQPMLPLASPAVLVFDMQLYGFRYLLREYPWTCLIVFCVLFSWFPMLILFSTLFYVYSQLINLIQYATDTNSGDFNRSYN